MERLLRVVTKKKITMNIFSQSKIFVIAEIANSHEGSLSKAKKLVEYASVAGADAVKFQKFTADELVAVSYTHLTLPTIYSV